MLGIKIDYKSVSVRRGRCHCEKMLPAAKMVQPRFIHKILREYIGGACIAGLSVTRFIYKPGKGRLESGKQGWQSGSVVYFFIYFFFWKRVLRGEMILSKAGVESVSHCSSASPAGELMETTQVGNITKHQAPTQYNDGVGCFIWAKWQEQKSSCANSVIAILSVCHISIIKLNVKW